MVKQRNMIRKAIKNDLSRIAEIFVFNNRLNYLPIFKDKAYSFSKLQVVSIIDDYFSKPQILGNIYVYDDGLIKGFMLITDSEIRKFYVDSFFQNEGIGHEMMKYAKEQLSVNHLWVLEKNERAIAFYQSCGFKKNGQRKLEPLTAEYSIELVY